MNAEPCQKGCVLRALIALHERNVTAFSAQDSEQMATGLSVAALHELGFSFREIGAMLGVSHETARRHFSAVTSATNLVCQPGDTVE